MMDTPVGFVPLSDFVALQEENKKLRALLASALKKIDELEMRVKEPDARHKELEARLNQNSNNSSRPPSSDGLKKVIKNNREKSNRKPGAQPGHKGSGLRPFTAVDKEIKCAVEGTCACGADLSGQPVFNTEKRQVIDLPKKLFEVTEYSVEVKKCACGKIHKAALAHGQRVQYGEGIKALLVYMNVQQQIPYERLQEFLGDIIGLPVSGGLIHSSTIQCSEHLEPSMEQAKGALLNGPVLHADETGMRCEGKTSWVHVLSNTLHTLYCFHKKRGREAMDAMDILPRYGGRLIHDRWASYDMYGCMHGLCNAHLLRELKYLHEEMDRQWAAELITLLQRANERKNAGNITRHFQTRTRNNIEQLVRKALKEEPEEKRQAGKRGRKPKSKAVRLLEVFSNRLDDVLGFLYHEEAPFDNNLAERDLRMIKLKQKISGCFRTTKGIETFCKIRSYISTVKKQNKNVWQSLTDAIRGRPANLLVFQ